MMTPEQHIKRNDRLKSERSNYDNLASDVADLINPRKSVNTLRTPGSENTQQIYEDTPGRAAKKCASGIFAYTIQGARWFSLKPRRKDLQDNDSVKRFYASISEELSAQIMGSNFPRAIYEALQNFVTMPAACIYLEEGGKNGLLNFQTYDFGSYVVANDADGIVDTIYRSFKLTPRQAAQKWGRKNLHPKMIEALDDQKLCDSNFDFLHCVYPREEYDDSKQVVGPMDMPFASEYIDVKFKHKLAEGGYQEFPYFVARFNKNPEDVYGTSPAIDMLPSIRGIQKIKQTMLIAIEKHVNPPWLIPDDGASSYNWSAKAGAKNYWRANGVGNAKPEPVQIQSDLNAGFTILQEERNSIRDGFFLDIFTLLENQVAGKMTATEVLKRLEEALNQLAPTWGNLQAEWYSPLIYRALGICARAGAFRGIEQPEEVAKDQRFDITYLSKIALASEMIKARSFFQFVEAIERLVAASPEFAAAFSDTIKAPETLRGIAYAMGMPIEYTYSEEESTKRAEARAEAAAQQAQIENAEKAASAVGKIPENVIEMASSQAGAA